MFYPALLLSIFFTLALAASEDCEDKNKMPDFNRVITYTYDGPGSPIGTEEDFERVLGSCAEVEDFSNDIFNFFSSFGFDTSDPSLRRKRMFTSPSFNISHRFTEHPSSRAILGSFYEFGEYLDSIVYTASATLVTNIDHTSSGQFFPAG